MRKPNFIANFIACDSPNFSSRGAKAQPTYSEPWIDYSDTQVPPSDRGPYHLTLI
jgi:hypothetical protein